MTREDGFELKKARISAKVTLMVVAERCFTSDRTVARWEDGEVAPSPDDLDRYSEAVGDPHLWHRMMRRLHDSYARHYPEKPVDNELPVSLLRSRYEMEDVLALHAEIERDSIDGKVDDPQLKERYRREANEAIDAIRNSLERLG